MAQRKTLTDDQLNVLRWIDSGCPHGEMDGHFHRISAAALKRRGLVTTSGRGDSWRARTTSAGREYLRQADSDDAPIARQANVSVTQQLIDDIIAAGGSLRLAQRSYYDPNSVDYENRARLAERYGKVPLGRRLKITRVSSDELQIDLVEASHELETALQAVPVPGRVARFHPVVKSFQQRVDRQEISRAQVSRALRILQALAVEVERRGGTMKPPTGFDSDVRSGSRGWSAKHHGHFVLMIDGEPSALRLREEGLQSLAYWQQRNRGTYDHQRNRYREPPRSDYEVSATGRLSLEIVSGYSTRRSAWTDRAQVRLEDQLPELLRECELRAGDRRAREDQARRAAQQRERDWEAAMKVARERHAEAYRVGVLLKAAAEWEQAERIRAYCDAVSAAYDDRETRAWTTFARTRADAIDPLRQAPRIPDAPADISPEELKPFLDGFSPYGPDQRGW